MKKKEIKRVMQMCVFLVTQNAYKRSKILKFSVGRNAFTVRLHEMNTDRRLHIINWLVQPEGFSLLMKAPDANALAKSLHRLKSATTGDYGRRSNEEPPFWDGRYRGAVIQRGCHLIRCSLAMDQLVTEKTKCRHPLEWKHSGSLELCGIRKRYRINQPEKAFRYMGNGDVVDMRDIYIRAAGSRYQIPENPIAIGSHEFIETLADTIDKPRRNVSLLPLWSRDQLGESSYALCSSIKYQNTFIRSLKW